MGILGKLFGGGGKEKGGGGGGGGGGGRGSSRMCMYGHPLVKGTKMCEHRHWIG